ncbi:MAG: hypothetical protein DIU80_023325, partial [Chloroflexota bacterium]
PGSTGVRRDAEPGMRSPPLAMERAAVLDTYFSDLTVEPVERGEGWRRIEGLARLWPDAA